MNINRIELMDYGIFKENQKVVELSRGINVIYGQNEAGKSTLRYAIGEMLYGFQHKHISRHPYQNGNKVIVKGIYSSASNEEVVVQRVLGTKPEGMLVKSSEAIDIGNEPIETIKNLPYSLYKGIFELDLTDMVGIEEKKWNAIEEQLTLQYSDERVKSAKLVLSELEAEMNALWKPTNRGNYAVKQLGERLSELKDHQRALKAGLKQLNDENMHMMELEKRLEAVSSEMAEVETQVSELEPQIEAFRLVKELSQIESELATYGEELPELDTYKSLIVEVERLKEEKVRLDEEQNRLEEAIKNSESETSSTREMQDTSEMSDGTAPNEHEQAYLSAKENCKYALKVIENKSYDLTSDPWNEVLLRYWKELDVKKMSRVISSRKASAVFAGFLILACAGLGVYGYIFKSMILALTGGAGLLFSAMGLLRISLNKSLEFGEIMFRENIWKNRKVFIAAVESLQKAIESYQVETDKLELLKTHYEQAEKNIIRKTPVSRPQVNLDGIRLQEKMALLTEQKRKIGHSLISAQQQLRSKQQVLSTIVESPENSVEFLEDMQHKQHRTVTLLASISEVRRAHPEWSAFVEDKSLDQTVGVLKIRMEELKREREMLRVELARQDRNHEKKHMENKLLKIEAEIDKAEQEKEMAIKAYNRARMIHTILSYADETYKQKYQPEMLKRASIFLAGFTGGKYDTLVIDSDKGLSIRQAQDGMLLRVHDHMSRGTLEQIYLALRLAAAQSITDGKAKLPLVLDEVFVNWDQERMREALRVLKSISAEQQVVYFTCHDWMRNILVEEHGANLVTL